MSMINRVVRKLSDEAIGFNVTAGQFPTNPNEDYTCGKVIFAGSYSLSDYNQPRNIMGGQVISVEVFKVILKGNNYCGLEDDLYKVRKVLTAAGYAVLSGIEHIETDEINKFELALTFKTN